MCRLLGTLAGDSPGGFRIEQALAMSVSRTDLDCYLDILTSLASASCGAAQRSKRATRKSLS